jgi:hypothetical protein
MYFPSSVFPGAEATQLAFKGREGAMKAGGIVPMA